MSGQTSQATAALSWSEIPVDEALPGVTRQVIQGQRQTLVRYVYAPGAVFPVHQHPQEQITLVLRGRLRFTVKAVENGRERSVELGPGEVVVIPGGTDHGAEVTGGEEVETLNMLSPRREAAPVVDAREQRP